MSGSDKVLYRLKTHGAQTAQTMGDVLGLSSMGARKHLQTLAEQGLVVFDDRNEGVGRPTRYWQLSDAGHERFPDRHGELTVQLITLLRQTLGEAGVDQLISAREAQTERDYRQRLAAAANLGERVAQLAAMRSEEGYMAEVRADDEGWLLIEHHCPICAAARSCQGFCRAELSLFQQLFAGMATVTRESHLLAGGERCVYRIGLPTD